MSPDTPAFFITGCTGGIGQHVADTLVARGDRVFATARNLPALTEHASILKWLSDRTRTQQLDVCDPSAWERVLEEAVATFGRIDVLMNVAGAIRPGLAHELGSADVHEQIDVNVKGVIFGTQAAARHMIRQGHGHIINVASFCGLAPISGVSVYSASKYAVRGFSLAVAEELRPYGVAVTVVCPDAVRTRMLDGQLGHDASALIFSTPRPLTTDDVTHAILNRALRKKPLEVYVPRFRGHLARLMDLAPQATRWVVPILRRRGLKHLRDRRRESSNGNRMR